MSRDDNYYDPYGSVPFPAPKDIPLTLWASELVRVPWIGLVDNVDTATWQSPVFDMRPGLRSSQSSGKEGVSIWNPNARFYIQLFGFGLANSNTTNLRLEYSEYANTTWGSVYSAQPNRAVANSGVPNQVANQFVIRVNARVDITSEIMLGTDQPSSVTLTFAPIGEGYPIRYWKIELNFTSIGVAGGTLSLQAAMY